jgi:hypothetical protein
VSVESGEQDFEEQQVDQVEPGSSVEVEGDAGKNATRPGNRQVSIEMLEAINKSESPVRLDGKPVGVKSPDKRITPKMRQFASLMAQGHSSRDAYRQAYDCSRSSEASIVAGANKLLRDGRVSELMQSVWESVEKNIIDDQIAARRHVLEQLYAHANDTKGRTSDKLKALELMGKAFGMFTDKTETKVEQVDPERLKRELDQHMQTFKQAKLRAV